MAGPNFLNLIEGIKADDLAFRQQGEVSLGTKNQSRDYVQKLTEVVNFVHKVQMGIIPAHKFAEAMTTSDFPYLFGDVIDRQVLANYEAYPVSWPAWAKGGKVPDFRTVNRHFLNGSGRLTLKKQFEGPEYRGLSEGKYTYSVEKYADAMEFSWESLVNDDLEALQDVPKRFGDDAKRTEEYLATSLIVDSSGPDATFFAEGNSNLTTAALTIAGLTTAWNLMRSQTDPDSQRVLLKPSVLAVAPALELTALQIVNAINVRAQTGGGATSAMQLDTINVFSGLKVVTLEELPSIASSNYATSWFLFADPNIGRGAVEVGFLRGHEQPEIFMKAPDAVRVGGGMAGALEGSFDRDAITYKVRHVVGGTVLDPRYAVGSNGTA